MKRLLAFLSVVFVMSLLISCSKDDPETASGDKNNMFRDWNQKPQKRTPAPLPGNVLKER